MRRLLLLLPLIAFPAFADIPPSDTANCGGKNEGDACETDSHVAGSCVKSTCSRNDYSQGVPPKSVSYECMKCVSSDAPKPNVAPPPKKVEEKKSSCATIPGELLFGLGSLLLLRRRSRS